MSENKSDLTRRDVLKAGSGAMAAAALAGPMVLPQSAKGANERLRVAVLGVNGRGTDHIAGFMRQENVEVAGLCDPDLAVATKRQAEFEKKYGKKPEIVQDLRKVFDDKNIDAVSIATPNHWHSLAAIWAMQAGKDVYVEKPGSHNVWEGRKMVEAAAKYQRIVQHGVQLRSSVALQEAVQHLRSGLIGDVYMARGLVFRWRPSIGKKGVEPVPSDLNYDLWTGPAKMRPFTRNVVHYNWHWTWDYGNGDVGNQGIHETDMCLWGLGVELPEKITAMGGKFLWDDDKETPEVLTTLFHYPKQKKAIQFEVRHWCTNQEDGAGVGNIFYGSEGYMVVKGYDTYETYLGQKREPGPKGKAGGDHYKNFVEAIRSRKKEHLNGPVETAHYSSALAHLGNIAFRTERVLHFDPKKEQFIGDKEANALLKRQYRAPYAVPDKV
ncbi:MAG: Gfo/Idh/MocA family protein [Actinomycetota bacterium]